MAGFATLSTELVSWIATFLMFATLILAVNMRTRARDTSTFEGLAYILAANLILFISSILPTFDHVMSNAASALSLVIAMHAVLVLGFLGILRGMDKTAPIFRILPVSVLIVGAQGVAAHMGAASSVYVVIAALGNGTLALVFAALLVRAVLSFSRELILLVVMPFLTIGLLYLLRLVGVVLALPDHILAIGVVFNAFVLTFALLVWCFTLQTFGNVRLARSLSDERVRAQDASKMKSRFLANMSHEIRTPLNGVLGMAQVLDDGRLENDQREMVRIIQDSGETLLKLLDDILDLSKVEAGKLELEEVPFVPRDLIGRVAKLHALRAKAQGIALDVEFGVGLDGICLGDKHRLSQVLNNLLNNAIKFTPKGGVKVVADMIPRDADGAGEWMIEISVIDTGIGMQPEQLSRIFQDFTQADETISRQFGGTGLGLSITQKLLELMGGGVQVQSRAGEGSTFHIWLPTRRWTEPAAELPSTGGEGAEHDKALSPLESKLAQGMPGSSPYPQLSGLRIMLAEDNQTNQRVVAAMLRKTGVELVIVDNGASAVELDGAIARGELPDFDLFLFDIQMPEMDGPDAFAVIQKNRLAEARPPARAAVLTANALPEQIADYLGAGFLDCLSKPIERQSLIALLQRFGPRNPK